MPARQLPDVHVLAQVYLLLADDAESGLRRGHRALQRRCRRSQRPLACRFQLGHGAGVYRRGAASDHLAVAQVEVPPRQVHEAQELVQGLALLDTRDVVDERFEVSLQSPRPILQELAVRMTMKNRTQGCPRRRLRESAIEGCIAQTTDQGVVNRPYLPEASLHLPYSISTPHCDDEHGWHSSCHPGDLDVESLRVRACSQGRRGPIPQLGGRPDGGPGPEAG
mmetsp:Transcript_85325/g.245039  ORF Transcript_85325/g.245039 Transcript_85325/m.245039 type:complete len:223 (-) Transcript_85325:98-766(-)